MPKPLMLSKLHLAPGKHDNPGDGSCIMEVLSLAVGAELVNGRWRFRDGFAFTDLPACTDVDVARCAMRAWDSIGHPGFDPRTVRLSPAAHHEARLRLLARFLPRLLRARQTDSHRVKVRMALGLARAVEHMEGPHAKECNDLVAAWLDGDATTEQVHARLQGLWADNGPGRAYWQALALVVGGLACDGYTAASCHMTPEALLDVVLDAHAKACAEEGLLADMAEPWEAAAVDFVDRLMAEIAATLEGEVTDDAS